MKLLLLCIVCYTGVFTTAAIVHAEDKTVSDFLGKDRLSLILQADKTESYRIDWIHEGNDKAMGISGFPILEKGKALDKKQLKALKNMIASPASYEFQWSKRTLLRPSYAIRLIYKADYADILIDSESQQWGFSYKENFVREDISKTAMPVVSKILENLFKNKEVQ